MSEKTFKIVRGDISDGYHTFDELYDHRCLLYLSWLVSDGCPGDVYWVKDHFPGWDLVATSVGREQISYHIPSRYRDIVQENFEEVPSLDHMFDGHTSEDVAERIRDRLRAK